MKEKETVNEQPERCLIRRGVCLWALQSLVAMSEPSRSLHSLAEEVGGCLSAGLTFS